MQRALAPRAAPPSAAACWALTRDSQFLQRLRPLASKLALESR
jgi:hypothetical protein